MANKFDSNNCRRMRMICDKSNRYTFFVQIQTFTITKESTNSLVCKFRSENWPNKGFCVDHWTSHVLNCVFCLSDSLTVSRALCTFV